MSVTAERRSDFCVEEEFSYAYDSAHSVLLCFEKT
jgi:hypothetical protein